MALIGEMKYLQIGSNTYEIPTGELPIASSSTLGGIKVGTNLDIDSSTGVLSVTGIPTISITRNLTSGTKSATINISGTDYDIYSETIPTNISSFTNDAGYITSSDISGKVDKTGDTITGTLIIDYPGKLQFYNRYADFSGRINISASTRKNSSNEYGGYLLIDRSVACGATPYYDDDLTNKLYVDDKFSSSVPSQASINSSGLITYSNSSGTSLFTLQLPLYNGGIS